jgi:hypothetical protein
MDEGGRLMDQSQTQAQQLVDLWKKQIDEGAQAWAKMMAAAPSPGIPDPAAFWRPLMDQGIAAWSRIMSQGPASPDLMTQWKQFLDQWIEAWSKALGQAMGTEAFAQALGRYLDQWLVSQGPAKKAAEQYTEAMLQSWGLPSRAQVAGVARQLVELEERLERLEDSMAALLRRRDGPEPR